MPTPLVINHPGETRTDSSGAGLVLGVIIAALLIVLFVAYALPALRNQGVITTPQANVQLPTDSNANPTP